MLDLRNWLIHIPSPNLNIHTISLCFPKTVGDVWLPPHQGCTLLLKKARWVALPHIITKGAERCRHMIRLPAVLPRKRWNVKRVLLNRRQLGLPLIMCFFSCGCFAWLFCRLCTRVWLCYNEINRLKISEKKENKTTRNERETIGGVYGIDKWHVQYTLENCVFKFCE